MRVSAIIPAYNEERTIKGVLDVLLGMDEIHEVIVVSDGSTDNTAGIARAVGATVVELATNCGKGGAMKAGLAQCDADIILFLDADLIGLTENHVKKLLQPVINNQYQMSVGIFEGGRLATDLAQKISPFLSGQRAVRRDVIDKITNMELTKFGIETALTRYVRQHNIRYTKVVLENMSHMMKEEKLGWKKGIIARFKMYADILKGLKPAR